MMKLNTNYERVDALTHISDQVTPILLEHVAGELRARRIVRVGIAGVALAMRDGETMSQAGERFDRHLAYELRNTDYGHYEAFRTPAERLPDFAIPPEIAYIANKYSDTLRGTYLADNTSREPDAVHVLHLTALAVPYARAHYPQLNSGKVAAFGLHHDLPEAYADDTPTWNISPEGMERKKREEADAIARLHSEYDAEWPGLMEIVEQYEALVDTESAFVKTMDKNDPGYTHFRNDAYGLRVHHGVQSVERFRRQAAINTFRTLGYASQFALVLEDKDVLNERIAKLIETHNSPTVA